MAKLKTKTNWSFMRHSVLWRYTVRVRER